MQCVNRTILTDDLISLSEQVSASVSASASSSSTSQPSQLRSVGTETSSSPISFWMDEKGYAFCRENPSDTEICLGAWSRLRLLLDFFFWRCLSVCMTKFHWLFHATCGRFWGQITEIRPGTANHAISVKCQYHQICRVLRTVKAFAKMERTEWTGRIMQWLLAGRTRFPTRSDSHGHKQQFGVIWLNYVDLCWTMNEGTKEK